ECWFAAEGQLNAAFPEGSFGPACSLAHPASNHTIRMGQHSFAGSLLFSVASNTGTRSREFAAPALMAQTMLSCAERAMRH
ncbi:MAG TPA: hypothetical protein VFO90_00570, partial [Terrimicrobiaceae bacterium]|nr:hypothetical protein [Terrimicrobiaceae bacterium]